MSYGAHWSTFFEFLFWWNTNGPDFPPLVGTGSGGLLGFGEYSLAGGVGSGIDFEGNLGIRFTLAYWCDHCRTMGWDMSVLTVPEFQHVFRTDECPVIGRQFCDAFTGQESSLLVAFPGIATGNLEIVAGTQTWGIETNVYANIIDDPVIDAFRLDVSLGFRYLALQENLNIGSVTSFFRTPIPDEFAPFLGDTIQVYDSFLNRNQFYGPQLGLVYTVFGEVGDLEIRGKLAFGRTHQTNMINGTQLRTDISGQTTLTSGGLLAQPTNIGTHTKDMFTVVPELTSTMRLKLCDNLFVTLGGTFIFWNRTIRPGDNIDRNVDLNQLANFGTTGPIQSAVGRPGVTFNQSNYTIYGMNIGIEFKW